MSYAAVQDNCAERQQARGYQKTEDEDDSVQPLSPSGRPTETETPTFHPLSRQAKLFAVKAACIASLGGLLYGFDLGVVAGALPQLRTDMDLSVHEQDLVVSLMLVGAFIGSLSGGVLCDRIGRWWTIMLTAAVFVLGGGILYSAQTKAHLYIGRIVVGFGVSVSSIADISYLSEVAPVAIRGAMVNANELMIAVGILLSYCVNYWFRDITEGWRSMFGVAVLLAFLQAACFARMPESPKWLAARGRHSEALVILTEVNGDQAQAEAELDHIKASLESTGEVKTSTLFTTCRTQLLICMTLMALQQLTGNAVVLAFTPEIIATANTGHTTSSSSSSSSSSAPVIAPQLQQSSMGHYYTATVALGCVKAAFTVLAVARADAVGRRTLLLGGSLSAAICLAVLGCAFLTEDEPTSSTDDSSHSNWSAGGLIAITAACGLVASYAASFGPVTWLITSEMFAAPLRGRALGFTQTVNWLCSLAVSAGFLAVLEAVGGVVTFWALSGIVLAGALFIYAWVPETRHREPDEISAAVAAAAATHTCCSAAAARCASRCCCCCCCACCIEQRRDSFEGPRVVKGTDIDDDFRSDAGHSVDSVRSEVPPWSMQHYV